MKIKISQIKVGERNRKSRKAAEIAESIKTVGFLNPITVSQDFYLIAGLNRLEAHKLLGLDEIECNVVNLTGVEAQIAEIDENLIRDDLTTWEQGVWEKRRKELYLEKYPNTANGAKNKSNNYGKDLEKAESAISSQPSFVKSTSELTGLSERAIRQSIQIATNLKEFADDIVELPIADKKTELLELARIAKKEPERAKEAIERLKAEPEKKLKEVLEDIPENPHITQQIKDGLDRIAQHDKHLNSTFWITFENCLEEILEQHERLEQSIDYENKPKTASKTFNKFIETFKDKIR